MKERFFKDFYYPLRNDKDSSTIVEKLEIRNTLGAVPHRFIVAYLQGGRMFRFDRRPEAPNPAIMVTATRRASDDYAEVKTVLDRGEIQKTTLEVALILPPNTDILLILSACYAMSQDQKAREYDLLAYNCWFFAWTIAMIVARHAFPFTMPTPSDVQQRIDQRLESVTKSITDKIVYGLLSIVLDTITTFRTHTGRRLYPGLSKRELAVWGLPLPALRLLMRQCLKMRLHLGLERKLKEQVRLELEKYITPVLVRVLEEQQDAARPLVEDKLWLDHLVDIFRSPTEGKILEILWDGILVAVSAGYADISSEQFLRDIRKIGKENRLARLKYMFFGQNVVQFSQVWNASLHAALTAARDAGVGKSRIGPNNEVDHAAMFNLAFKAGRDAALTAAQDVVNTTGVKIKSQKRASMWNVVWEVWNDVWESSQKNAEKMVVDLIESTVQEIVGWVATDVVTEFGESKAIDMQASIKQKVRRNHYFIILVHNMLLQGKKKPGPLGRMPLSVFQQNMKDFIHSAPGAANIETAMIHAWEISRTTYRPLIIDAAETGVSVNSS